MEKFWNNLKEFFWNFLNGYGLNILKALALFVLGILIIRLVTTSVKKNSVKSRRLDNAASTFITSLVALIAYVALALLLVGTLGFSTAGIVAAFSSVMLAIALGMQNTLSSLTNGILLIFTKPFQSGDYVDIGGTAGTVKEIKLFSVKVVTPDNLTVIIPNSTVLSSVITNYSRMPLRRLDVTLPVSYDADVATVKRVINDFIKKDKRIVPLPAPFFRLTEYGASSLNFTLRVWTDPGVFWDVKFDLLEGILEVLRKNKIDIPY
ncbi:MAG: mechanosensitive ion channel family protein, partial [Christensenellaceae bacterium]